MIDSDHYFFSKKAPDDFLLFENDGRFRLTMKTNQKI